FAVVVGLGIFVNLGYNGWSGLRIFGMEVLDFFDFISNSVLMPIVACLTCIVIGWLIREKVQQRGGGEAEIRGTEILAREIKASSRFRGEKPWAIMVKYVAPVLVIAILVWNIIGVLS
ncbi:MAG: hypothetical protein IKD70_08185, partial [Eggerthellaceae bacterium]|nr:hypothetical protein [Eggerthellaceae bacterium]